MFGKKCKSNNNQYANYQQGQMNGQYYNQPQYVTSAMAVSLLEEYWNESKKMKARYRYYSFLGSLGGSSDMYGDTDIIDIILLVIMLPGLLLRKKVDKKVDAYKQVVYNTQYNVCQYLIQHNAYSPTVYGGAYPYCNTFLRETTVQNPDQMIFPDKELVMNAINELQNAME